MNVLVLYSGGKDSSLVAYLLEKLGYKIKLLTANFGIVPECYRIAEQAARSLGYEFEVFKADKKIIEEAADMAEKDGFPLNAINFVHKQALEEICRKLGNEYKVIADGTRRDDKTPKLSFAEMQSLEDRYNIEYLAPLRGISYKSINYLTDNLFKTESIKAGSVQTAEYETEIRALLKEKGVNEKDIFPEEHFHTIVKGYKDAKEKTPEL